MSDQVTEATTDTSATSSEGQEATSAAETLLGTGKEDAAASTEAKAEGEQKQEDQQKAEIPEKYEFKAPEGQELDAELVSTFEPIARDLGLTQENAQKLVDLYSSKILPRLQAEQLENWTKTVAGWAETAKADKEYGGEKLTENLAVAKAALDKFGTPELTTILNETKLGDHPELIRFVYRIGKAISEDSVMGSGGGGSEKSAAQVLFG
jgi:hypothetical protein